MKYSKVTANVTICPTALEGKGRDVSTNDLFRKRQQSWSVVLETWVILQKM